MQKMVCRCLVGLGLLAGVEAQAAVIPIANSGFDAYVHGTQNLLQPPPGGLCYFLGSGTGCGVWPSGTADFLNWSCSDPSRSGGAALDPLFFTDPPSGTVIWVNTGDAFGPGAQFSQDLGISFQPGMTYQLSVWIYDRVDTTLSANPIARVDAGSTVLSGASVTYTPPANGHKSLYTWTYTTGSTPPAGPMVVVVGAGDGGFGQINLDNVSLEAVPSPDSTPPAAVADLSVSDIHPNSVVLHWTSTGDDGMVGPASSYDVRCSSAPITEGNFTAATSVPVGVPKAPGSAESLVVHNLTGGTTYYFAIKVLDNWPNTSGLSNLVSATTPSADTTAPAAITDLQVVGMQSNVGHLAWTTPADAGSAGLAGYDVRYSTSPINASNWASAMQALNESAAAAPGTTQQCSVRGLASNTAYYFAVKSFDWAEPANISDLSNVVSGTTAPAIVPVTLHNPWITNDRVANTRNLASMAATFDKAYMPDGVVLPAGDQDRAINEYNNFKRREYHWGDDPPMREDVVRNMNIHGHSLCGGQATQNSTILNAMGLHARTVQIPGHTIYEVNYDGAWHLFDTMTTMYVFGRSSPPKVASADAIKADGTLMTNAPAEGRACPGFLLCPDSASWFANALKSWYVLGDPGSTPPTHSMNMDLRFGDTLDRTCQSWANQYPTPQTDADSIPGVDPPYHHDARNDWKDTVNFPYWEPYALTAEQYAALGIGYGYCYRRWSNGTCDLRPDFTSAGYLAAVSGTPTAISTVGTDGLMPELHAAAANTLSSIVFKITLPFEITDANISGDFLRTTGNDLTRLYFSTDAYYFYPVWDNTSLGTTHLENLNIRARVFGLFSYYIKVEVKGALGKTDAGVNNLVISTVFQHNKGAMAYLDKGVNHITVTFDNPAELAASGAAFKVTYQWKEYDGTDWTIPRSHEQYILTSPTTFTLVTAGSKVPRTESIQMQVSQPPFDPDPPARITDLVAGLPQMTSVPLTWTASGDNGTFGTATRYELRYSTAPITDDASFTAATQAANLLPPRPSGMAEAFTVSGLTGSTTYHFAIKAFDEVGNGSVLSNIVTVTTAALDTTAPEAISDLAGRAVAMGGTVELSWTAPADYGAAGAGPYTCDMYDVRYSTSPIDEGNWAAASQATGEPSPAAPGAAETFIVTGLAGRTLYYFAVKAADASGNVSSISNTIESATSTRRVVLTPVADLGLYGGGGLGGSDYSNRGTGGRFDIGLTQSALLRFDLAGTLAPDEMIVGAVLQLADTGMGSGYSVQVVGYPLAVPWQEGLGNAGTVGDTGFPWGPASIGDAVYAYREVTAVGPGTGSFASTIVATDGVSWNTPGGRGIGTDVIDCRLFGAAWPGSPAPLVFTAEGTAVLRAWSTGTLANYGMNLWATSGTGYAALASREYNGNKPQLVVTVGLIGDFDSDGHVDVVDLLYLVDTWGKCTGDSGYDPRCDANGDECIDVVDLLYLVGNWGV